MKPLGPYVAARDLPGRMNSPVRTLRATDRLTGMPVLLHGLPAPMPLPDLPEHPNVLLPAECVEVAGEAFMVTELPLQARPAQDPALTARGALLALTALHGRGVVHGGLSASQLWSVDGEVRLAGAGLPWGGEARPADDLYALAVILHEMGEFPPALRPLLDDPGRLDAQEALRQLSLTATAAAARTPPAPTPPPPATALSETGAALTLPDRDPPADRGAAEPASAPDPEPGLASVTEPRGRRERRSRFRLPGVDRRSEALEPPLSTPDVSGADRSDDPPSAVKPDDLALNSVKAGPRQEPSAPLPAGDLLAPLPAPVEPLAAAAELGDAPPVPTGPSTSAPDEQPHDGSLIVLGEPEPPVATASGRSSPQERRRREHEARREQAALDAQAAAERRRRQESAPPAAAPVVPAPLQIGFDDDLPVWEADGPAPTPGLQLRDVPRLPASLRRAPLPPDEDTPGQTGPGDAGLAQAGTVARRRTGEPIRIGWDEDDSWRVVREAPTPQVRARRPLLWRVAFWGALGAGLVLLTVLMSGLLRGRAAPVTTQTTVSRPAGGQAAAAPAGTGSGAAAAQPQTVQFTVRGAPGVTARLSVEQAPAAAKLAPGASLGRAPGRVTFPAPGTYRVRVVVDGYAPGSMTVTVPRAQPVTIDLDR
ncbi:PEGA domain-containing protein [Deinococcus radiotolerans]|uniref:PEGA domain-containing protein n=1 Tax=Deinococcus radiotolerans TaxID=1309407 RepID=A0ABQ2FLQ1_9DEIO|nr:PEGA domain-containing protein [Deinococcus radiotolerans]GGL04703.1 hypothetical protein GCM10010844_24290 [Deinococcus radiotolerans]